MPSILKEDTLTLFIKLVLNLVISGMPSIPEYYRYSSEDMAEVLNLVISGMPSIPPIRAIRASHKFFSFKPCYKWNAFNTLKSI